MRVPPAAAYSAALVRHYTCKPEGNGATVREYSSDSPGRCKLHVHARGSAQLGRCCGLLGWSTVVLYEPCRCTALYSVQ